MPSNARLVQRIGLAIVAAGLVAGAGVYVSATADPEADAIAQQREMREVERLGGTATVQTVKFNRWLASMWQGQNLAVTLAVLGLMLGGAFWWVGGLMAEEVDANEA